MYIYISTSIAYGSMSICLGFSSVALQTDQLFARQIVCCCLSILVSNCYYTGLTGLQCLCSKLKHTLKMSQDVDIAASQNSRQRSAFMDNMTSTVGVDSQSTIMGTYTVQSSILRTIDFDHRMREIRLFVSREELWYIQYPVALACFIMFLCVPMYNIACVLAMSIGFLFKNIHDESKRGFLWKRDNNRTILFVLMAVAALLSVVSLCPIVTVLNGQLLSQALLFPHSSQQVPTFLPASSNGTANTTSLRRNTVQLATTGRRNKAQHNTTGRRYTIEQEGAPPNSIGSLLHNDESETTLLPPGNASVLDDMIQVAKQSFREPNIAQKITTWVACFCVPFSLATVPDSVRLPVILEILQPSLSCLAAILLCITLFVTEQDALWNDGLHHNVILSVLSEWVTVVYIFTIPACIWVCVYLIMKCVRNKTISLVCCLLICFAYLRTLQVADSVHDKNRDVSQTLIFIGFLNAAYIVLTINFCRVENKAIQTGWDAEREEDLYDSDDFESEDEHPNRARYTINNVLDHVTSEIEHSQDSCHNENAPIQSAHTTKMQTLRPRSRASNKSKSTPIPAIPEDLTEEDTPLTSPCDQSESIRVLIQDPCEANTNTKDEAAMFSCVHVHVCASMSVFYLCLCFCLCLRLCIHVRLCACEYLREHARTYTCTCTCARACACV